MEVANEAARRDGRDLPYPPLSEEQGRVLRKLFGTWHWNPRLAVHAERLATEGRKITNEDVEAWEKRTGYSRGEFRYSGQKCRCAERRSIAGPGEGT